ncbi:hypothetical protein [Streptomyces longisporoflavus]|uniref:Uncharacterized protein n=1 Tax=Streptomyces longisporoflavus TaxID=28044 RepID=A0ABW7QSP2_9ACTN
MNAPSIRMPAVTTAVPLGSPIRPSTVMAANWIAKPSVIIGQAPRVEAQRTSGRVGGHVPSLPERVPRPDDRSAAAGADGFPHGRRPRFGQARSCPGEPGAIGVCPLILSLPGKGGL